ncbi:MAG: hypothetical protein EAZ85_02355 [Bacteroidetes bacterium]|nr:MAG: hypothetical protein EAZ85_02355 [Bacteroidota bacterium]TAG90285.1 MAG: hypothetical protein EAZ20_04675 [Bacteroidota bacterium]
MSNIVKHQRQENEIKFYKTAEFKKLSIQKRREMLENYAKNARNEVTETFEYNKKQVSNIGKWAVGLAGGYLVYRVLFSSRKKNKFKKDSKDITEQIDKKIEQLVNYKEKKLHTRLWSRIQNQIFEFAFDWLLDSVQEKFKKYTHNKDNDNS